MRFARGCKGARLDPCLRPWNFCGVGGDTQRATSSLHACTSSTSGSAGVEQVEVISEDGSPHGPKCFVLWNPPLTVSQKALNKGSQMKMSRTEGRARLTKGGISK